MSSLKSEPEAPRGSEGCTSHRARAVRQGRRALAARELISHHCDTAQHLVGSPPSEGNMRPFDVVPKLISSDGVLDMWQMKRHEDPPQKFLLETQDEPLENSDRTVFSHGTEARPNAMALAPSAILPLKLRPPIADDVARRAPFLCHGALEHGTHLFAGRLLAKDKRKRRALARSDRARARGETTRPSAG